MEDTYTDEYGVVFSADRKKLIKTPKDLKEYIVPEGTKVIGACAFRESVDLEYVIIPKSVERIESYAFSSEFPRQQESTVDLTDAVDLTKTVKSIEYMAFVDITFVLYKGTPFSEYTEYSKKEKWGAKNLIDVNNKDNINKKTWGRVTICMNPSEEVYYEGWLINGRPTGDGTYYRESMASSWPEVLEDSTRDEDDWRHIYG